MNRRKKMVKGKRDSLLVKYLLLGLFLFLTACGETNQDVLNRFQPQFTEMRRKLQEIAKVSESVCEQEIVQDLDPQPTYVEREPEASNTEIVMYAQLLDPDVDLRDNDQLDLLLSNQLIRNLQWTSDASPFSASALKKRARKDMVHEFERSLNIAYLAIAKVVVYTPVVAVDQETFQGGIAEIDGYLVDMESQEIMCSFKVSARPEEKIFYQVRKGEDAAQELAEAANSNLWANAREAFVNTINETCGVDFTLK